MFTENELTSSLVGLNALICGSTAGIGFSTAMEFSELGANVTLFARNKEKLKKSLSLLSKSNNQSHQYLTGDFNNPDTIREKIKDHIKSGNNYHILINNSGGPKGGAIVDAKVSEFIEAFNRHLICNHILSTELINGMKSFHYGRIVNIISTSVKEPIKGLGVSNTIRGSVASWSKTLSIEVAQYGITVNNILPGFTETDRLSSIIKAKSLAQDKTNEIIAQEMKNQIPAGRFGQPLETAKAIAYLVSPSAGYINGVSLAVDGGRLNSI
ncbi:MAG: short-chain dehydrogenase [Acidimicrobiaceae bacterium]|nr:short-chain dehydrogenase [Acidimicrobiaceae bacterium]|tara:strand:+ start:231 stop:1037 length:807 start_codon:yes stop_codon:yes gene_type:complete